MTESPDNNDEKPMDAADIKAKFLELAAPLVDEYVGVALGTGNLSSTNASCRQEVWSLLRELIISSSEKINMEIGDIRSILKLVESGKCTVEQGQSLIEMYKKVRDTELAGTPGMQGIIYPALHFHGPGSAPPVAFPEPMKQIKEEKHND